MSNRWFYRQHQKDSNNSSGPPPNNFAPCRSREKGGAPSSPPRIQLTACSPTAGRVPPLAAQGITYSNSERTLSLELPNLQLPSADSLDNIAQHIPRFETLFAFCVLFDQSTKNSNRRIVPNKTEEHNFNAFKMKNIKLTTTF